MHGRDAYAIGRALARVQNPSYGRGRRNSLPDHTIVLHRDEAHTIAHSIVNTAARCILSSTH